MADPMTIGLIGIGSQIGGGLLGAFGALASGQAQEQQSRYQAGVAQYNAQIAKQNADYAMNVGEMQAQRIGLEYGQRAGAIIAGQGASGIDVRSGSALQVQKSEEFIKGIDLATIRANAAKDAFNEDVKAQNFLLQSNLYEMAGDNYAEAGRINAESSVLGTVGSVASKWYQGSQVGMFSSSGGSKSGDIFGSGIINL